jgi:uncharacterized protein YllA (UPF0747 family)
MKGNFLRAAVIWFVGLGLILSVGGILYTSWENSQAQEKIIRKQTLDIAKQLLDMQNKLKQNGEIAKHILDNVVDNQGIILNKTDEILKSQIDEMTIQINKHQKESRQMFMDEFKEIRENTEKVIVEQIRVAIKDLLDKETYTKDIAEIGNLLKSKKANERN